MQDTLFEYAKNFDRHTLAIGPRVGIPREHQDVLYRAMRGHETQARLLVTLFFMADLPIEAHSLTNIEANLKLIFPPIGLQKLRPEDFGNFRVTCITSHLHNTPKYFVSSKRGHWVNTDEANGAAIDLLRRENVMLNFS